MAIIRKEKFIFVEANENHNKLWYIEEHDNNSIITKWGRVGNTMAESTKSFDNSASTSKEYDKLVKSKIKKGYTKLNTIEDNSVISNFNIESIALEDIDYDKSSTVISDMIKLFCKENIHNIISNTNINFNSDKNIFTTPAGVVTIESINEAKNILNKISEFINNKDFGVDFIKAVEHYCSLIPQKVSRKFVPAEIFNNQDKINIQQDVLTSLTDSINIINEFNKDPKNREKVFNTSLKEVTDKAIIDKIINMFNSTKHNMHACRNLKIKRVFEINIKCMKDAFDKTIEDWKSKGKDLNKKLLWHGTKKHNIISIMKKGLIIPPATASYCTGRMFSNGLYFSDQSTKSLNYSYGYWDSNRDSNCYMFLADVLMGKEYVPYRSCSTFPKGYDSIFAKAGRSGVINNEMVVPNTNQANLKYLIEFSE